MSFRLAKEAEWSSCYRWINVPEAGEETAKEDASSAKKEDSKAKKAVSNTRKAASMTKKRPQAPTLAESKKQTIDRDKATVKRSPQSHALEETFREDNKVAFELTSTVREDIPFTVPKSSLPTIIDLQRPSTLTAAKSIKRGPETSFKIRPDPILRLKKLVGVSYGTCPHIEFNQNPKRSDEFAFACGNVLVHMNSEGKSQRFSALEYSLASGELPNIVKVKAGTAVLFTVDSNCSVTVWDNSLSNNLILTFTPPLIKVNVISFNNDESMVILGGKDQYKRDMLIVYKLNPLVRQKKLEVEARQLSDFEVAHIEWSPDTENVFTSCGNENVYFWTIKKGSIPGKLAVFQQPLKGKRFVGIAHVRPETGHCTHVVAATECGTIFRIKVASRVVEQVVKIADAISCFLVFNSAISRGSLCPFWGVSSGKVFRLWDSVRNLQLLEHSMEGNVLCFAFNLYGDKVAILDNLGNIGMIKLESQLYEVLVRSHTEPLVDLDFSQPANLLLTASRDSTVRAWSCSSFAQVAEFSVPQDQLTGVACSGNDAVCACVFVSGFVRVLDLAGFAVLGCAGTSHRVGNCLKRVCYSRNSETLAVADVNGKICLLDARERRYETFKTIEVDNANTVYMDIAFSADDELFGHIGSNANTVCLWETTNYSLKYRLDCAGEVISKLQFPANGRDLLLLTATAKLKYFRIDSERQRCYQTMEVPGLHDLECTNFCVSDNCRFVLTCSKDYSVKVFDYMMRGEVAPAFQGFLGHQSYPIKLMLSPKGNAFLVSISGETNFVHVWDCFASAAEHSNETLPAGKEYERIEDTLNLEEKKVGEVAEAKLWVSPESAECPGTLREVRGDVFDAEDAALANKSVKPQYVIGYNSFGHKNLLWLESKWFAYTSTNKLVVELLEHSAPENRKQFFISFGKVAIDSLTLSSNKKYVAAYSRQSASAASLYTVDTRSWKVLSHIPIPDPVIHSAEFSLNNSLLMILSANSSESTLHFYDYLAPELLVRSALGETATDARWNVWSDSGLEFVLAGVRGYEHWLLTPELALQRQEGKLLNRSAPLSAVCFTEAFLGLSSVFLVVAKEDGTVDLVDTRSNSPVASVALARRKIRLLEWKQKRVIFATDESSIFSAVVDSQE